jgi:SNF2 family DNA or RNA helicase
MKKEDYLDMPQAIVNDIKVKFPEALMKKYKEFEKDAVLDYLESLQDTDSEISALNAAGLRSKLLQFANGAIYDEDKNVHEIHDLKLQALEEIIDESNGKPVLVAWSFQHDRDRILKKFKNAVQLKTDKHIKDWNAGKIPIMLMHPASGGHGLNLQAGGHIIAWYGLNDSLELYEQFNARLDRQGQKETVVINRLIVPGTEDISVANNLSKKNKTQAGLMEAVKALVNKYQNNFKK